MKKIALLAVIWSLVLSGSQLHANTLTLVNSATPITGTYDWHYTVVYVNSQLRNGDFVSLSGAGGITSATAPAGWTTTFTATSVLWTWMGGTTTLGAFGFIPGFDLHSLGAVPTSGHYASQDHVASGTGAGTISTASGSVDVPVPEGGSALVLLGIALTGVEGMRRLVGRSRKP